MSKITSLIANKEYTIKVYDSFVLGICKCGCNEEIQLRSKTNCKLNQYKKGHNNKGILGEKHWCWEGGIRISKRGYAYKYSPNHIRKMKNKVVALHRLVYEEYYNCCLLSYTIIHHINGNRQDNRIENLKPLYNNQHTRIHSIGNKFHKKDMSNRICLLCNSNKTRINKRSIQIWKKYDNGFICAKCNGRLRRQLKSAQLSHSNSNIDQKSIASSCNT